MKIKILIGTLVLIACLLAYFQYTGRKPHTLDYIESEIGLFFPQADEFTIQKNLLRQGNGGFSRSIEATRENRRLRIEITTGLSAQQASQTAAERLTMIHSLYSNLPSPYPGMVTNKITMDATLQPHIQEIEIENEQIPLYILPSNARYTYGAMNKETVAYIGGLCFLFNLSTETLYRLDFFVPKEEFDPAQLITFIEAIRPNNGSVSFPGEDWVRVKPTTVAPTGETKDQLPQANDTLQFKDYNLILIALEPLGANHVSSYGYNKITTPNLDAFATKSFLFENAVSSSSWSLPAFMSWFTSLYPSQHKVINKYSTFTEETKILAKLSELSPNTATLAQIFRQNGYRTAGFTGDASLSRDFGFDLGFEEYFDEQRFGGFDITVPMAENWLSSHTKEKMFLFVQGYDVHGQFPLERKNLKQFLDADYKGSYKGTEKEYWDLRNQNIKKGEIDVTDEDMRLWRAIYDAKIFGADQRLGSFFQRLHELNLMDNSIIIISSGSGNEYNEHGRIDHGFSLYEELIHVPLLIRIPGFHGLIPDLVRTVDIMPTVIELLALETSAPVEKQMQGVSLLPLLKRERLELTGISETDYLSQVFKRSIKTNDGWKLIVSLDTEERELYNLTNDPGEQKNLIESEGRRAYELEQLLFNHLRGISGTD